MRAAARKTRRWAVRSIGLVIALTILIPAIDIAAAAVVSALDRPSYRFIASAHSSGPIRVVAAGDSLASGYRASAPRKAFVAQIEARLERARPGSKIWNVSKPGAHVRDLGHQLDRIACDCNVVLLIAGGNDVRGLTDPLTLLEQERALLDSVHRKYPGAAVAVANIPDVSVRKFRLRPSQRRVSLPVSLSWLFGMLVETDNLFITAMAKHRGATILDLYAASTLPEAGRRDYISSDGLHPNDAGQARLAAYVWPSIAQVAGLHVH